MLAGTEKGKAYTEAEIRELLRSARAKSIFRIALELPLGCAILAGRF